MTAAAIRATFSEWRMVKGRKVLQLVLELPLEQQPEVAEALGYPMPDRELWVAVARLDPSAPTQVSAKSERAKATYANATPGEQAVIRAALLAKDEQFQRWASMPPPEDAAAWIRHACGIASRSELATNAGAFERFLKMEAQYRLDTGALPEMRG